MRGRGIKPKARAPIMRRAARKLPLLLLILAAVTAAVAAPFAARAGYRYVAALPAFAIRDVQVSGLKYVRKEDFIRYIGEPRGKSILGYGMEDALRRSLSHPWIKSAVIRRDFPGTIRFEFSERVPAAVATTREGTYLIDTDGYAVAKADGPGWEFLPVVHCPTQGGLKLLDAERAAGMREALSLMSALRSEPSEGLAGAGVTLGDGDVPGMVLDGATVKVGRDGYADKVRRLAEVMRDLQKRGLKPSLIDLRFPGKVVVR